MSHCTCPSCGASLTITAEPGPSRPAQRDLPTGQPQRRFTSPHGPTSVAEAMDYTLPLGRYRGQRLGDVAKKDPNWVRWGAAALDRTAGKACSILLGTLGDGPEMEPDKQVVVERAMADGAY